MRGSKPGEHRGGRKKGSRNKRTAELAAKMAESGELPLDYMLRVMRDETVEPARRDHMAQASAVYVHPRLQSTVVKGEGEDGEIRIRVVA